MNHHDSFVYFAVRGYNEFYNQYKEILEGSYGEKKEKFQFFCCFSDERYKNILIASSSHDKL